MDTRLVEALAQERVDWRFKGFPATADPPTVGELAAQGWNLLAGDLLLPVLVLKREALEANLRLMAAYCDRHGVDLAPHAKTSMAPQLLALHLDAGAWGFTVATTSQARVLRAHGCDRLLLASQVVEPRAVDWLSGELDADESFELLSLVDSVDGVGIMDDALRSRRARRPLRVLVELGQPGGRTGARSAEEAVAVAKAVQSSERLELAGVEGFEGLIEAGSPRATMDAVDGFLAGLRGLTVQLAERGAFDQLDEVIVSAGGSAFFDRVVHHLTGWDLGRPVRTVLRSGCYSTHDAQMYEEVSPLAGRAASGPRLQPALEVWSTVWSRPEAQLAILGMGKRDAAYDYRLPAPTVVHSRTGVRRPAAGSFTVTAMNDQHTYVSLPAHDPLAPGDFVGAGISHPCAAFDRWRLIPVVDDDYTVVDGMFTFF